MIRWLLDLLRFLRFSRTVTTLPFAVGAYVAAVGGTGDPGTFVRTLISIVLGAVTFLFYNRGYRFSSRSRVPRDRERNRLFSALGPRLTAGLTAGAMVLFILNAYYLNSTAFYLSPVALVVIFSYVPSRYHTELNHYLLGLIASFLVVGPYVAVVGREVGMEGLMGGLAVLFWIGGFDVIYSLKNVDEDREQGHVSIPLNRGPQFSLYVAAVSHLLSIFCFFAFAVHAGFTDYYLGGMTLFSLALAYAYWTIREAGHVQAVRRFFRLNTILSIGFFTLVVLEELPGV